MSDPWLIPPEPRPAKAHRSAKRQHLLSSLFESFCAYLSVEREASASTIRSYRSCFGDFLRFAELQTKTPLLVTRFSSDLVKAYQYHLAERELSPSTVRVRLSVLASFGRWALRNEKIERNPLDLVVRPPVRAKLPSVPRWDAVQKLLDGCPRLRDRALVALMAYGGLRRGELVTLDVKDFDPAFGLRKVHGKGNREAAVPLPKSCLAIVIRYLTEERPGARADEPMSLVRYRRRVGKYVERRMDSHRVWKLVQSLGKLLGIPRLHPHALRHACAVELLKRTNNLRAVQEHLRHKDVGTTTIYTRLLPQELQQVVRVFDRAE